MGFLGFFFFFLGGFLIANPASRPLDTSSTEAVVEARLLNFRDVAELQERNIQLLAVVRELSANRLRAFQFSLMYIVFRIRIRIGSERVIILSGAVLRIRDILVRIRCFFPYYRYFLSYIYIIFQ